MSSYSKQRLTKLEFIEKLGDEAFMAILQMAKASPSVEAWVAKMELTTPDPDGTSVDLCDPRTIAGIEAIGMMLEAQEVVSLGWAQAVLATAPASLHIEPPLFVPTHRIGIDLVMVEQDGTVRFSSGGWTTLDTLSAQSLLVEVL